MFKYQVKHLGLGTREVINPLSLSYAIIRLTSRDIVLETICDIYKWRHANKISKQLWDTKVEDPDLSQTLFTNYGEQKLDSQGSAPTFP